MEVAVVPQSAGDLPKSEPSTDMWQDVGTAAVHEAVLLAHQLLSSLQAIDVENLTGDLWRALRQKALLRVVERKFRQYA